jgi:hypothetical protein
VNKRGLVTMVMMTSDCTLHKESSRARDIQSIFMVTMVTKVTGPPFLPPRWLTKMDTHTPFSAVGIGLERIWYQ